MSDDPSAGAPWRVGNHYGIHVYEDQRPVATFHAEEDARRCVQAVNAQRSDDPSAGAASELRRVRALTVGEQDTVRKAADTIGSLAIDLREQEASNQLLSEWRDRAEAAEDRCRELEAEAPEAMDDFCRAVLAGNNPRTRAVLAGNNPRTDEPYATVAKYLRRLKAELALRNAHVTELLEERDERDIKHGECLAELERKTEALKAISSASFTHVSKDIRDIARAALSPPDST
jgi:DNA repair exonuclease SbcCD ATPase subunit